MVKIGDKVTLKIKGAPGTGTGLGIRGNGASITIGPGASFAVQGTIIEDQGEHWVVRLSGSIGGKETMLVSKDSKTVAP